MCPHYDTEPVRQPALKKILKRTPQLVGIALDELSAIEVVDGKYRILTADKTAKAQKAYWQNEKYVLEEIKESKTLKDLNTFITKPTIA